MMVWLELVRYPSKFVLQSHRGHVKLQTFSQKSRSFAHLWLPLFH